MKKTEYAIVIKGTIIDIFNKKEEAIKTIQLLEEFDMDEGVYQPGLYEIKEINKH